MALNAYDAAKHHIGLGPNAEYGFMLVGAYSKDSQRELGGAADYGGATDLIGQAPGLSRWTQDDFSGGAFQYRYDKDVAMFAGSKGFVPSQQSRSLISVAPVFQKKLFNPSSQSNPAGVSDLRTPLSMFSVAGSVYIAFSHGVARYRHDTDTFTWGYPYIASPLQIYGAAYDFNEQMYYYLTFDATLGVVARTTRLVRFKDDFTLPTNQQQYESPSSSGQTRAPHGFQVNDQNVVVALGLHLYTFTPPLDTTAAGKTGTWTDIGRLPGYWVDSTTYNGMTYILCATLDGRTSLVAFDGTAILPITDFPFNFNGRCLAVYGGRVYVGGTGYDISGNEKYAELHEVTGASVRLVRTFAPESRSGGGQLYPKVIRDMAVAEGLLWIGMDGDRLLAYDLTSDGFFGASEIQLATLQPYKMTVCRGHLYMWNRDASSAALDGLYRVAASGDAFTAYSAQLVTSDFIAEPAVDKRWSQLVTQSRYVGATADYSLDSGTTWTALTPSDSAEGDVHTTTFSLAALPASRHIRFRFNLSRGSSTDFAELIAFTVSFAFASTGKYGWIVTVNGSDQIEGRDGHGVTQDVPTTASSLWGWRDATIKFKDLDGSVHDVMVQHVTEQQPIIGENVDGRPEAYYSLTLAGI